MRSTCLVLAAAISVVFCLQEVSADYKCKAISGTCQFVNAPDCNGEYLRGLCSGSRSRMCCRPISGGGCTREQKRLACKLYKSSNVNARTYHESREKDNAFAKTNLRDMCYGEQASRSRYRDRTCKCKAPGGSVCLNEKLLKYLVALQARGTVTITELAGACHGCRSFHYAGRAVDLSWKDGRSAEYVKKCNAMGGWGNDENDHVHCQF